MDGYEAPTVDDDDCLQAGGEEHHGRRSFKAGVETRRSSGAGGQGTSFGVGGALQSPPGASWHLERIAR